MRDLGAGLSQGALGLPGLHTQSWGRWFQVLSVGSRRLFLLTGIDLVGTGLSISGDGLNYRDQKSV